MADKFPFRNLNKATPHTERQSYLLEESIHLRMTRGCRMKSLQALDVFMIRY